MKLKQFYNSNVNIIAQNGRSFSGYVSDYFYPEENDNGKESIVVDTETNTAFEFYESDIKTIEKVS